MPTKRGRNVHGVYVAGLKRLRVALPFGIKCIVILVHDPVDKKWRGSWNLDTFPSGNAGQIGFSVAHSFLPSSRSVAWSTERNAIREQYAGIRKDMLWHVRVFGRRFAPRITQVVGALDRWHKRKAETQ